MWGYCYSDVYTSHILMSSLALCTIYHLVIANCFSDMHLSVVYMLRSSSAVLYFTDNSAEIPHICVHGYTYYLQIHSCAHKYTTYEHILRASIDNICIQGYRTSEFSRFYETNKHHLFHPYFMSPMKMNINLMYVFFNDGSLEIFVRDCLFISRCVMNPFVL